MLIIVIIIIKNSIEYELELYLQCLYAVKIQQERERDVIKNKNKFNITRCDKNNIFLKNHNLMTRDKYAILDAVLFLVFSTSIQGDINVTQACGKFVSPDKDHIFNIKLMSIQSQSSCKNDTRLKLNDYIKRYSRLIHKPPYDQFGNCQRELKMAKETEKDKIKQLGNENDNDNNEINK